MPASGAHSTPSRNAPCPCGSGKKYKRCCGRSAGAGNATPPDRLEQVIRLYQQGNLQAAGQLAEQLLRAHPDDASLAELTAAVALQTGNAELAAERFARQIQLQPDNALAHSNLCMALHTLGRDEEAFRSGQRATQLDPALADAWNNLGNIYKSGNHLEGAREQYEKALTLAPNDPEILVNAGATSHLLGDLDTAEQRYRSAIAGSTRFASAHNNLGAVLQHQGRLDDAAREFRTALRLQPDNAEFLTNLGALMIDLHEKDKAIEYLEKAMQIAPDYEGAWTSMGNLLDRYNDQDTAQEYYEKALLFNPENSTALCNIAYRLYELGEQKKAIEYFVRALKSNPNSPKGLAGLGKAMLREDNTAKAREYIDKSLKLAPWDIHAHIANAHLLDSIMETEQAETEWLEVLAQQPNMAEAHIGLANHYSALAKYEEARRQFRKAEEDGAANLNLYHAWSQMEEHIHNLEEAERLAARAVELDPSYPGIKILESKLARRRNDYAAALDHLHGTEPDSIDNKLIKASLLFELGTVQDKLGNYAEAFSAYDEANKAKNCYTGSEYDTEFDMNRFRRLREFFNTDNWQALTREIPAEDASLTCPVFIVGFPRSGTSLLEQILGSHSEISPAGELKFIGDLAGGDACRIIGSDKQYPDCLINNAIPMDAGSKTALRNNYLERLAETDITDVNPRWITDKMPHNAMHIALIRLLFPHSPVIHISRHPLNSCLSAYFANFKTGHRYTSSLPDTARHYVLVMQLLEHYRAIGIDFMEIHYEDLVNNQESVTRQVLEYIGAPWEDACLQHHKSKRVVKTASYEQVTQKIYTTSLNRYQNYWDEVQDIIPILQSTMEQFGYTVEPPPDRQ